MTSIERTAYPTFQSRPSHQKELDDFYTSTQDEILFIQKKLRRNLNERNSSSTYEKHCFNAMVLLKCFQRLGYFPDLRTVPENIIAHIRQQLKLKDTVHIGYKYSQVLYRHQAM